MAVMLPIKKKSYKQPQSSTQIDWSNPITKGLVFAAIPAGTNFYDVISGQFTLTTGVMRPRATIDGGQQSSVSLVGGVIATFPDQTGADRISGPHSVFIEGSLEVNGGRLTAITSYEGGAGNGFNIQFDDAGYVLNGIVYGVNNSSGLVNSTFNALGTNSEKFTHRAMLTSNGTNGKWYTKGALNNTTTFSTFPTAHSNRRTRLLGNGFGGAACSASVILVWDRELSLEEYRYLYQNPWQIFKVLSGVKLPNPESGFKRYNKPRKKQPQNVSALNRANPLTRELAFLQVGSNPAIDFVSNHKAQLGNNNFPVVSSKCIGVSNNGSSIQATFPHSPIRTSDGVGTGDFTLFFYGAAKNVGARSTPIAQTSAGRTNQVYLIANSDATITPTSGSMAFLTYDSTNNINGLAAAGTIDDNYHFWVGVRSGTTYTLYRDGVVVGSTSGGISSTYSGGEQVTVGGMYSYTTYNSDYPIVLTGAYNRSLNVNEVQELTRNPWQLYAPQSTSIFVPVTSGSPILLPSSIPSSEAFGTAIIIPGDVTITVNGIASAEAFGNATVSLVAGNQILDVSGIATSEAFGTAVVTTNLTLFPTGIASGEAFGNHTIVGGAVVLALTGIPSAEAFGTAEIIAGSSTIVPTGIPSGEAFGSALVSPGVVVVFPSGIASAEAFGTPVTLVGDLVIYPNGIPSGEAFGIPTIIGGTPVDTNVVFYVRGFSSFGGRRNA